jgi:hypothetical protein
MAAAAQRRQGGCTAPAAEEAEESRGARGRRRREGGPRGLFAKIGKSRDSAVK